MYFSWRIANCAVSSFDKTSDPSSNNFYCQKHRFNENRLYDIINDAIGRVSIDNYQIYKLIG